MDVERLFKRLVDIAVATLALVVFLPVLIVIAVLIRVKLGRPIFYLQLRAGKACVPFTIIKFRTMLEASDEDAESFTDSERLTSFGSTLRRTSLDELPELWNVIIGDMSLVGPRPLLMRYLPFYTEIELKRHDVRPGITGLAQVSGRNFLNWNDRLAVDVEYVDKQSFLLDLKILWLTLVNVIARKDIAVDTGNAMRDLDDERRTLD